MESATSDWEGGAESGMREGIVDMEESKGGMGGKGLCAVLACEGESRSPLSRADGSDGFGSLRGRSQSGGGMVGIGKAV